MWEFCEYNELPKESRQESLSCVICMDSLTNPGMYGYTKIAICHKSAKHMLHASCLFRNTFKTGNAPRCPTCRCPFVPTKFHESFADVMWKATTGDGAASDCNSANPTSTKYDGASNTIVDCDSDIYKYILEYGTLLHISNFNYTRLFIPERALLLGILNHIKCNGKKSEDPEYASMMTPEFAGDMIEDIIAYEPEEKLVLDGARKITDTILTQLYTPSNPICWDTITKDVLDLVLLDKNILSNFSFQLLSNLVYLVIESKLTCSEKVRRLTELIPTFAEFKRLKLNQLYSLVHLLVTKLPDHHESLMGELEKKNVVAYFKGTDLVPHTIPSVLSVVEIALAGESKDLMRQMIQNIKATPEDIMVMYIAQL